MKIKPNLTRDKWFKQFKLEYLTITQMHTAMTPGNPLIDIYYDSNLSPKQGAVIYNIRTSPLRP